MIRFVRFSPSRLALVYIALSVLALVFDGEGAKGLATAMESQVRSLPGDKIMVFADPSKRRLAGNLAAWPAEVPDGPGTYGLVIGLGGGSTMRVVASHAICRADTT